MLQNGAGSRSGARFQDFLCWCCSATNRLPRLLYHKKYEILPSIDQVVVHIRSRSAILIVYADHLYITALVKFGHAELAWWIWQHAYFFKKNWLLKIHLNKWNFIQLPLRWKKVNNVPTWCLSSDVNCLCTTNLMSQPLDYWSVNTMS